MGPAPPAGSKTGAPSVGGKGHDSSAQSAVRCRVQNNAASPLARRVAPARRPCVATENKKGVVACVRCGDITSKQRDTTSYHPPTLGSSHETFGCWEVSGAGTDRFARSGCQSASTRRGAGPVENGGHSPSGCLCSRDGSLSGNMTHADLVAHSRQQRAGAEPGCSRGTCA